MVFYFYLGAPFLGLFIMFVLWIVFRRFHGMWGRKFSVVYIFCFMRLGVYFLLLCGWGSDRKYSLLGGYRAISQTISYEVTLIFFVLVIVYYICCFDLLILIFFQSGFWLFFISLFFFVGWFFLCLAEANRTPFDFSEGESELVSGFNVDYGGGLFSLIFICEYGIIIFLCFFDNCFFFGGFFLYF